MLFFNANFICYYFYPTKKREEPRKSPWRNEQIFRHGLFVVEKTIKSDFVRRKWTSFGPSGTTFLYEARSNTLKPAGRLKENKQTSLRSLKIHPNRHFVALLPKIGSCQALSFSSGFFLPVEPESPEEWGTPLQINTFPEGYEVLHQKAAIPRAAFWVGILVGGGKQGNGRKE